MAQITLIIDEKPGPTYDLADEPMTIGRTRDNGIAIRDRSMSRQHAELCPQDGGWMIRDLESRNGIRVNGEATKQATLMDGDVITLGETTLRYRDKAPHVTPINVKVPSDLIKIPDEDEAEISINDSRSDALARIDEIALPSEGDLAWEPIAQIKITLPVGDGPEPGDPPLSLETLVHHPADREPLMPSGDALMALARPHLARRAELFRQVHSSMLSATDVGVLWTEVLNLVRRLTEQPWAAVLMPPSKPGPLHLQLNGEDGHRAQVPRVALEGAIRSGHLIHWSGGKSDPLSALALAPWGDDDGVLGLVIAPTQTISPAEAIPLLDAIGGLAMEIGQWWQVLNRRWSESPAVGPQPLPPMPLNPPPPL